LVSSTADSRRISRVKIEKTELPFLASTVTILYKEHRPV
jgi:hypothetical protein